MNLQAYAMSEARAWPICYLDGRGNACEGSMPRPGDWVCQASPGHGHNGRGLVVAMPPGTIIVLWSELPTTRLVPPYNPLAIDDDIFPIIPARPGPTHPRSVAADRDDEAWFLKQLYCIIGMKR